MGVTAPEIMLFEWRDSLTANDEQFRKTQLCLLLSDIVCLKQRERFFRIATLFAAVAITCADTASDLNVTLLYLQDGSKIGVFLLVHLIVALVSERGTPNSLTCVGILRSSPVPAHRSCKRGWPKST